jgi:hypothetical protein
VCSQFKTAIRFFFPPLCLSPLLVAYGQIVGHDSSSLDEQKFARVFRDSENGWAAPGEWLDAGCMLGQRTGWATAPRAELGLFGLV